MMTTQPFRATGVRPALRLAAVLALLLGPMLAACARLRPGAADSRGATPAPTAGLTAPCRWTSDPTVLHRAGDTLYQVWTLPASRARADWRPADMPALAAFRRDVATRLHAAGAPTEPAGLLQRQIAYYAARSDRNSQQEAENGRRVLAGTAGTVRPLSCVEALLLDYQARRFPMVRQPTEFHAFILRRGGAAGTPGADAPPADGPLLVYFAASGAPWPPGVGRLAPLLEAKVHEGWRLAAHLHNHPFYLDRLTTDSAGRPPSADIAGALAPSITDVQFYRSFRDGLGLEAALVTDGFATLDLPAAAFDQLHARGELSSP